jgi:hypothetical protein
VLLQAVVDRMCSTAYQHPVNHSLEHTPLPVARVGHLDSPTPNTSGCNS